MSHREPTREPRVEYSVEVYGPGGCYMGSRYYGAVETMARHHFDLAVADAERGETVRMWERKTTFRVVGEKAK